MTGILLIKLTKTERSKMHSKRSSGFTVVEAILIIFALGIIGCAGWLVYKHHHATDKTANTTKTTVPVATNVWIGKGKTGDWSNAANWSLGTPVNGQNLKINIAQVLPTWKGDGIPNKAFNDDIKGLVVHDLIFTGSNSSVNNVLNVSGDTLTVTHQILNDDASNKSAAGPQIDNNVILDGNVAIDTPNESSLAFDGSVSIPKTSSVQVQTARIAPTGFNVTGVISELPIFLIVFDGAFSGTGAIHVTGNSSVAFDGTSPDMDGTVTIASGAVAQLSNTLGNANISSTLNTPDDLGTSSIDIQNGGNLEINSGGSFEGANQTPAMNIANNITMSGDGSAYTTTNSTGKLTGAITSCLTGQGGCTGDAPGQTTPAPVTFSGTVTLAGNTELGTVTDSADENPVQYAHTSYIFKKPIVNPRAYTLSAVSDSLVQIVRQ